jgi:NADPH:quinone reductase-like Zn-dependent oxidoreductase
MKAMTRSVYGSAEVLEFADVDRPAAADNEVLIRVHAAGAGPEVWHLMTGLPYLVRIMGFGLRTPKNPILGSDFAGVVEAVGKDVRQVRVGDELFGTCAGSFAEYACARTDRVAPKPGNLTLEQAAVLPTSGCTALQGLRDVGRIQAGQSVLIIGASGGVGTFAVQLAKAFGAEVTGVCRTDAIGLVRSIGADHVIDYTRAGIADGAHRYDVIIDIGGNRPLRQLRGVLARRGTLVIVGGETGGRWLGGFDRSLRAPVLARFVPQRLGAVIVSENAADLLVLAQLIESGQVTPVIDKTYPLSQAPDAIRYMQQGHARGKVVITV